MLQLWVKRLIQWQYYNGDTSWLRTRLFRVAKSQQKLFTLIFSATHHFHFATFILLKSQKFTYFFGVVCNQGLILGETKLEWKFWPAVRIIAGQNMVMIWLSNDFRGKILNARQFQENDCNKRIKIVFGRLRSNFRIVFPMKYLRVF